MPTLDDLTAAFADLESRAPDSLARPLVPPSGPRRGRTGLVLLSAAAVVTLTVGAAVVAPHLGARPIPAASGQPAGPTTVATSAGVVGYPTGAGTVATSQGQAARSVAVAPVSTKVATAKPALSSGATAPVSQAAPATVRVPFRIAGVGDLTLRQAEFDGTNGGVVIETAGTTWDFGWTMAGLNPSDKPGTDSVTFGGQDWVVQHAGGSSAIMSLWVTAPGFGMTITPVGKELTLDQYKSFLAHVSFPKDLDTPSTWPTAADLG